jgi:hypothetical protein
MGVFRRMQMFVIPLRTFRNPDNFNDQRLMLRATLSGEPRRSALTWIKELIAVPMFKQSPRRIVMPITNAASSTLICAAAAPREAKEPAPAVEPIGHLVLRPHSAVPRRKSPIRSKAIRGATYYYRCETSGALPWLLARRNCALRSRVCRRSTPVCGERRLTSLPSHFRRIRQSSPLTRICVHVHNEPHETIKSRKY